MSATSRSVDLISVVKSDSSLASVEGGVELLQEGSTEVQFIDNLRSRSESEQEFVCTVRQLLNVVSRF